MLVPVWSSEQSLNKICWQRSNARYLTDLRNISRSTSVERSPRHHDGKVKQEISPQKRKIISVDSHRARIIPDRRCNPFFGCTKRRGPSSRFVIRGAFESSLC